MFITNLSHADGAKTFVPYDVKYIHTNSRGIKVVSIDHYIEDIHRRFKRTMKEVTNEVEAKALFLDFLEVKKNVDEVYMPSGDMDEYTLEKINHANELENFLLQLHQFSLDLFVGLVQSQ